MIPPHLSLAHWLGTPTAQDAVTLEDDLRQRYAEPHRAYHNLAHVAHTLAVADELRSWADNFTAVGVALWFHDAIYDPQAPSGHNEIASANLAREALARFDVAPTLRQQVHDLILVTHTHEPTTADERVVVDADLAILAAPPSHYAQYAQAIRQEYAWVATKAYRAGRTAVLQRFLSRPHLFHTPPLQAQESQARANLKRELAQLANAK